MAEEKKNRSEELESLDKKINEIINGLNFYSSPANFLTLIHHAT